MSGLGKGDNGPHALDTPGGGMSLRAGGWDATEPRPHSTTWSLTWKWGTCRHRRSLRRVDQGEGKETTSRVETGGSGRENIDKGEKL